MSWFTSMAARVAFGSLPKRRGDNQDGVQVVQSPDGVVYLAVADGHGTLGGVASAAALEFVKETPLSAPWGGGADDEARLSSYFAMLHDWVNARMAHRAEDNGWRATSQTGAYVVPGRGLAMSRVEYLGGTTLTIVAVTADAVCSAYVGDSLAVAMTRAGDVELLTPAKHVAIDRAEFARVAARHPVEIRDGRLRLGYSDNAGKFAAARFDPDTLEVVQPEGVSLKNTWGEYGSSVFTDRVSLAMTRSLGDEYLHRRGGVTHVPSATRFPRRGDWVAIAVGSDGVWDSFHPARIPALLAPVLDGEPRGVERALEIARAQSMADFGDVDDITLAVMCL